MNGRIDAERILDAFLAPESDRLPDRVIDAALADIARTPQRRAPRVPWRFPLMPARFSPTTVAAVALVAVIGAGALIYLNLGNGNDVGGLATPTAPGSPSAAPTPTAGTAAATAPPSWPARPGIPTWTAYTSEVYRITFGYPESWRVEAPATRAWQIGDASDFGPFADVVISPDSDIAVWVFRMAAEPGADISSREGLGAFVCEADASLCQVISDAAEPMCLGEDACLPAVLVHGEGGIFAYFADTETRMVTVVYGRAPGRLPRGGPVRRLDRAAEVDSDDDGRLDAGAGPGAGLGVGSDQSGNASGPRAESSEA